MANADTRGRGWRGLGEGGVLLMVLKRVCVGEGLGGEGGSDEKRSFGGSCRANRNGEGGGGKSSRRVFVGNKIMVMTIIRIESGINNLSTYSSVTVSEINNYL